MNDEHMDDLDGWSADLDQARASVRDTAPIIATAYRELVAQGLSPQESAALAGAWIAALGRE